MSLFDQITSDIKAAMLAKDKDKLEPLRAIKSVLLLAASEKGAGGNISAEAEIKALQKQVKQRKEAAEIYQSQDRNDLAGVELRQAKVIEAYLPEQLGEEEIKAVISKIISETKASSMADMGKVIGAAMKELSGQTDGKVVSSLVKEMLI
ncbi:MAG: glutamyl-tRNA amidotransferase [Flavobacteriales bacterium]|nr:GatB/YqeY domain-containing protein [Bacteroidales bacterium AH-315-I05]PCJ89058.1 MAG: glutamyl-tRNA amidotransferase [Flavobacteriales bacterium]